MTLAEALRLESEVRERAPDVRARRLYDGPRGYLVRLTTASGGQLDCYDPVDWRRLARMLPPAARRKEAAR